MRPSSHPGGRSPGTCASPQHGRLIPSDSCTWDQLCVAEPVDRTARSSLDLHTGWSRRWTATWKIGSAEVVGPVRDMHAAPITAARPMRRFSWRTGQLHRPSLAYSTDTDRLHGAESHKEALTLLALEFAGDVTHVLGQPFALRYSTGGKARSHIPDVLATTATDVWLIDVRPASGSSRCCRPQLRLAR